MSVALRLLAGWALFLAPLIVRAEDTYQEAVLADKPYAYYRLGEASDNDAVADEVGKNPGAFVNEPGVGVPGAILTEPKNTAVQFTRSQKQCIKLSDLGHYGSSIASGFSIEYWLKTANSKDHQTILGTANSPHYITDFLVDVAYEGVAGRLRLYCRDDHWNRFNVDFFPRGKNTDIYDFHWHHLVHVYDPKAPNPENQWLLYIDGERQEIAAQRKNKAPAPSAFNKPVILGAMDLRGDISDFLDGALDEVALYTAPLSADRVAKHYRAAGYREHDRHLTARRGILSFPALTPVTNANPAVRHETD